MTAGELKRKITSCAYLDIHCHCDSYPLQIQDQLIRLLDMEKILCFSAGTDPLSWIRNGVLSEQSDWIISCRGIHPWKCGSITEKDLDNLKAEFSQTVMINEIGLDTVWAPEDSSVKKQIPLFRKQLALAGEYKKPVTIHTKGAETMVLDLISSHREPMLIHWYDGPEDLLPSYLALGCYFTIPPAALCKPEAPESYWNKILNRIPPERLLPETDNPSAWPWLFQTPGRADQIREIYQFYGSMVGKRETMIHNQFKKNLFDFLRLE